MIDPSKEYILCAAYHYDNGIKYKCPHRDVSNIETGIVAPGFRHGDCIELLMSLLEYKIFGIKFSKDKKWGDKLTAGFLTSKNRFVKRAEAAQIAFDCGQIEKQAEILASEDLYGGGW